MKSSSFILKMPAPASAWPIRHRTAPTRMLRASAGLRSRWAAPPLDLTDIPAVAEGSTVMLTSPLFKEGAEAEIRLASTGWYRVNLYNSADLPARPAKVHIAP